MPTFEILTNTKTRINDVIVLSQKNRQPDDDPGAQLSMSMLLPNHDLVMFDGKLKSALYSKSAASSAPVQAGLEGVEPVSDLPNLSAIGRHIGLLHWKAEYTGFTLVIDQGMGGASNIEIDNCVLSNFTIDPKEGGSVAIGFKLESQDVPPAVFGKLATLKNREVEITLAPPEVSQQEIGQPVQKPRSKPSAPTGKDAAAGDGYVDDTDFPAGSPEAAFTASQD
jgi:hypothetical protein